MQVSAVIISSAFDNVLRRKQQFLGSWAEFVALLGPHKAGPKNGRAVVPYAPHWYEGEEHQPRSDAHNRPGARWSILTLDLDENTEEELSRAFLKLQLEGVSYLLHSTHSDDPSGQMKARLHMPLSEPICVGDVPGARARLAAWLGLKVDKATKGGHTLFYTPRCPSERLETAFLKWADAKPVQLSAVPELPAPPVQAEPERAPTARANYREDWPEGIRAAARDQVTRTALFISHHRDIHFRDDLKKRVGWLGGFIGSGILDEDSVMEVLETACDDRVARFAGDDKTADERIAQIQAFIDWGVSRPVVPQGYDPLTGQLSAKPEERKRLTGREAVRERLKLQTPDCEVSVEQAAAEIGAFLRLPRTIGQPWVGVVEVSVGTGKTYQIRKLAAERAEQGDFTIILSLDHALLGQIRRDLEADGVGVHHIHSVMQPTAKTGGPECQRMYEVPIQRLLRSGANVQRAACNQCEFRRDCAALKYKKRGLDGRCVIVAPYDMAERAIRLATEEGRTPLLVCDEEPPPPEQLTLRHDELLALRDSKVWGLLTTDQSAVVMGLVLGLVANIEQPLESVDAAREYYGQLHLNGFSEHEEREFRSELNTVKRVLRFAGGWNERVEYIDKAQGEDKPSTKYTTEVVGGAWRQLREEGGFVLSATPNPRMYEALGIPMEPLQLRVKDSRMAARTVLYTSHSSRRTVLPNGQPAWDIIEADIAQMFAVVPPDASILLGTYKAISDALKTTHRQLFQGRDVETTHYEVVRGRDDWKERDAFVSLYDPRIPPRRKEDGKLAWDEVTDHASRVLTQFHGRARDPQPRERAALHLHIGTIPPSDWWADGGDGNAVPVDRATGQPAAPLPPPVRQALVDLHREVGTHKRMADVLDVRVPTLRRWLKGESGPRGAELKRIIGILKLDAELA